MRRMEGCRTERAHGHARGWGHRRRTGEVVEPPPLAAVVVAHHRAGVWICIIDTVEGGRKEASRRSTFVRSMPPGRKEAAVAIAWSRVAIAR
jgi:hypothetical protein